MYSIVLIALIILVLVLLGWYFRGVRPAAPPTRTDTYVCPRCNERHCDCHKEDLV